MTKKPITKTVDIKKLVTLWGNEKRIKEEVLEAQKNHTANPNSFNCIKCGQVFQPAPYQWVFYKLCDTCFKAFDKQKMMGRMATSNKKGSYVKHFEDVNEWIMQKEN